LEATIFFKVENSHRLVYAPLSVQFAHQTRELAREIGAWRESDDILEKILEQLAKI